MAQIVTITNPLTGQPAQVDQLEHTAQQIDDAIARALPGGAIDTALQKKADASVIDQIENDVNVLDSRMNEFTSLPDGSTSGDAELADIRVAANGKTYPNAGNAVRAQYSELKQDVADNSKSDAVTKRSLDALWKLNQGISYQFETDNAEAYSKTVPSGAKLASVDSIGGHTEVIDGELVSADVESVVERGKNLLNHNLESATRYGITVTKNGDGTFTVNGTATKNIGFELIPFADNTIFGKKVVGCPSGGGEGKYGIYLQYSDSADAWKSQKFEYGDGLISTGDPNLYPRIKLQIYIYQNAKLSNVVFKPMVTDDLSATYDDFVPYHLNTYPVPDAVRALPGYGWSAGDAHNSIERTETGWQYVQRIGSRDYQDGDTVTDGVTTYYVLDNPVITDITDMMDGILDAITVETCGTLTFENTAQLDVPNAIEYAVKLSEVGA